MSAFDIILIVAVTTQCVVMAELHDPWAKAFMLAIPVPVGFGILSVATPLNVTHATGLLLSLGFTLAVLNLHKTLGLWIIPSIIIAACAYCVAGIFLSSILPHTRTAFWIVDIAAGCLALIVLSAMPQRNEPPYRNPLKLPVKVVVILFVVTFLVFLKKKLCGVMSTFPMLGVVASYETRKSLYTTSRIIPMSILAFSVAFAICFVLQDQFGLYFALSVCLLTYMTIMLFFNRIVRKQKKIWMPSNLTSPKSVDF
jgi:hypothetical protein